MVDVYRITLCLESEEADAHGQEYGPRLEVATNHVGYHPSKEIGVFEIAKQSQIDDKAEYHQHFLSTMVVRSFHATDRFLAIGENR